MKYLKLFEAFDSNILTKTLGFIKNSTDKKEFITRLKNICSSIDLPFSRLSDDYFEYLPFQKALEKADITVDEPCVATSKEQFSRFGVEGSKCEGGKLKRIWGSRLREVECPVCEGSGVKPKYPTIKLLKFWFDKDGKYITTTAVDGLVKKTRGHSNDQEENIIDPYTWNVKINTKFSGIRLLDSSIYEIIKDANFAIILDFGKLEVSGFKTKSDVEVEREESKRGATAFMEPDDIKNQNIMRYLTEISKRSDLTTDISNVDKVAKRFLGGQHALFLINRDRGFEGQLTNLITFYYSYIEEINKGGKPDYYADRLYKNIKSTYENTYNITNRISNSLQEIKHRLNYEKKDHIYTEIIDGIEYLSQLIYQQFSKLNLETIEDLEIFAAKTRAIREVCRSDRYKFSKLTGFFQHLSSESTSFPERSYDYLVSSYFGIGDEEIEVLNSITKMKRIIMGLI